MGKLRHKGGRGTHTLGDFQMVNSSEQGPSLPFTPSHPPTHHWNSLLQTLDTPPRRGALDSLDAAQLGWAANRPPQRFLLPLGLLSRSSASGASGFSAALNQWGCGCRGLNYCKGQRSQQGGKTQSKSQGMIKREMVSGPGCCPGM